MGPLAAKIFGDVRGGLRPVSARGKKTESPPEESTDVDDLEAQLESMIVKVGELRQLVSQLTQEET